MSFEYSHFRVKSILSTLGTVTVSKSLDFSSNTVSFTGLSVSAKATAQDVNVGSGALGASGTLRVQYVTTRKYQARIRVTAEDGSSQIYTITITRPINNDATLYRLSCGPSFNDVSFSGTNGTISVPATSIVSNSSLACTNLTIGVGAVAKDSGNVLPTGGGASFYLSITLTFTVASGFIQVTSEDGASVQIYKITVTVY